MKKPIIVICGLVLCFVLGWLGALTVSASNVAPGGPDDPVVSKSYVDARFSQLSALIQQVQAGQTASGAQAPAVDADALAAQIISQVQSQIGTGGYAPVELAAGQVLIGHEGAQIILRSGKAAAYSEVADGLSNITNGADMKNGAALSANNLLIVPRYDKRGVKAVSGRVWVLVNGGYDIQ